MTILIPVLLLLGIALVCAVLLTVSSIYFGVKEDETYMEAQDIAFKVIHKRSVPYMSAFEVGTSFFNPRSLTTNHYLTFGHNTIEYLKNYPFITVKVSG